MPLAPRHSRIAHGLALGAVGAAALGTPLAAGLGGGVPADPPAISANALDTVNNCGMDGAEAHGSPHAAENDLKNRYTFPQSADYLPSATFASLVASNNEDGFDTTKAAAIEGYITEVKAGGVESCNCHSQDPVYMDTHIYVAAALGAPKKESVIAEVTPRIRMQVKAQGRDWSTPALGQAYSGKHVRISGWLFYDGEHENAAENIKSRPNNWRATCWEIHPITSIEVIP